ncbi:DUF3632 domain-containing protein [Phanerochaete sordida]|uniref:DUF3632 domain-containing protein n=1 Tax=Phanerochaete sordida TaxID=48140 RepID=A0A9P3GIY6_9APHY|nr:DUF3632 domain-containing protein [Phanerochaete sordida]
MSNTQGTQSSQDSLSDQATTWVDAIIVDVKDISVPPVQVADKIVSLLRDGLKDHAENGSINDTGDTPGLEGFLWCFWGKLLTLVTREEPGLQGRVILILQELKTRGKTGFEGMTIWSRPMDWNDLPLFGAVSRENINCPDTSLPSGIMLPLDTTQAYDILSGATPEDPTDPTSKAYTDARAAWLNLVRFFMQVWAADVYDFALYGIWFMRAGLEDFDPADPGRVTEIAPPALDLEAASVCVQVAGAQMYRSHLIAGPNGDPTWDSDLRGAPGRGGKRWTGIDGYSPDRWKLWKTVFGEYVAAEGKPSIWHNAVQAAKAAIVAMDKVEEAADLAVVG